MLPVIALVGRPNVGKSTLYNRLTRTRDAIVADFAGLTRDRHYGTGKVGPVPYLVVDTGGFEPVRPEGIVRHMASQAELAIEEADAVIFVTDARTGLAPQDHRIAQTLRESGRRVYLAVNKAEGLPASAAAEFYELGIGEPYLISAAHGQGIGSLMDDVLARFAPQPGEQPQGAGQPEPQEEGPRRVRVAIAGRPNVGKSTLVNALLGEERVVAYDMPGTTRDAIDVDFDYDGRAYTLVDTAGLRKKGRVFEAIEKFSVVKTLQAIADSNVVVLVIDAQSGVAEHDAHIAAYALESGRALVVAINKWDGLDRYQREQLDLQLELKLKFLHWARFVHISALKHNGLNHLMQAVHEAWEASQAKLSTPKLTRSLIEAVARQQPPRVGRVRPKMRYAHQGGSNPPVIVIHGNSLQAVGDSYRRYLESWFRDQFGLAGTPLRIEFRVNRNPYVQGDGSAGRRKG
ncbi:ribosome biogenesis GTPase Der [Mesosutterella sp. OilRF-GAM-744-9]|uniref:GTPase Der n=1 Tax=Mesosutterella porci TaxID=2915351 RepID=A0ABS9MT73_9BURK|nr:ribosome biogenesis GTPase Der [Mesosutterella sp. oilRF-744-WT-GAM-9]MCG5031821.1 ribosome biogenesis GTPase Der [Mesosutterella sp. oilRF-744-WT-GAM-9]